jgi:3-keto-disaccharide hydrolase
MISLLRCAAALFAVSWFSLPVQVQSSIPGSSGPRDTRSAARFQTPVVAGGNATNALTPAERAAGWTLLFDGRSLAGWQPSEQAVWSVEDGMIISRGKAPGILRTIATYQNFELKADFWADDTMNSGIFVRCPSDLNTSLSSKVCYEVNIYDPHASWPTGSVNEVQTTLPERIQAAGKWNSYEIMLEGSRIVVKLNGKTTVDARNDLFASGTIALQANGPGSAGGAIRFRSIRIRPM